MSSPPSQPSESGLPTPITSVAQSDQITTSAKLDSAPSNDDPSPDLQEVALNGYENAETREKLSKLNYLLKASGIYSKIIADNIQRERAAREAALKKHVEHVKKPDENKPELRKPDLEPTTRRSSRNARKSDCEGPPSRSKASTVKPRDRRRSAPKDNTREVEKVTQLLENARNENEQAGPHPETEKLIDQTDYHQLGQPALITGATMRPYQLAGMHWLATLYENGLNGILADEMGLGKTLQTIAFLCYLRDRGVWGPFLVVCPLSTVANWVNEFERFCPTVPVVLYHGTQTQRDQIRASRMAPPSDEPKAWLGKPPSRPLSNQQVISNPIRNPRSKQTQTRWTGQTTKDTFPVVVTSYEIVMNDRKFLSQYAWSYIVVDESHRLKNLECKLVQELKSYQSANRLLLTGTPLHNNLKELWSLLNFILPEIFDDYSSFEQWFDLSSVTTASDSAAALSTAQAQHIVSNLHAILKPFLLRRVKSEVETALPKKKEYLLSAPLTPQQKELYDAVINRNLRSLLIDQKRKAGLELDFPQLDNKRPRSPSASPQCEDSKQPSKRTKASDAASSESSSEEDMPIAQRPKPSKRQSLSRRATRDRQSIGYKEKSDSQFFKEIETGNCDEIDYTFDDSNEATSKTEPISRAEWADRRAHKSVNQMKLQNVVMQLRKVCNHPWLFDWPIDPKTGEYSIGEGLVSASGKMLLLDKLLKGLFDRGHKVLIFSQFTSMLDIIHDWATILKGWSVCRIDGATSQDLRRQQMKDFNETVGPDACNLFLLSTRAGGVGINLVAADTVILFDSDWNPQQDLQAQDRVHRIGQTKPVLVFRLVSGNTVESKILQKASQKRKLEALVIGNGFDLTKKEEEDSDSDEDIQTILLGKPSNRSKHKSMKELAEALLKTDGEKIILAEQGDEILGDSQLETLLDRSDEAMERKLGWKADSTAEKTTSIEVYQTKSS
ncbi:hypothetical protein O181_013667 [Austropuccinia psidii MF-1]|uniref:Lymphoid-specific helicase n=1 Tax=Austropuccinia psidii MF-1 TaxID=1389203 RepID=A0A9Q3GP58_9BASI|nr:hypothetical protein [Austropuccinia psidii MF-1]